MSNTDDTDLVVEVLDVVFGPALCFRTALHGMVAAGVAEVDTEWPDHDVTLASPIAEIRDTEFELMARAHCSIAAMSLLVTTPIGLPTPSMGLGETLLASWLLLNCAVLWADPLAPGVMQLRTNTESKTMNENIKTDGGTDGR